MESVLLDRYLDPRGGERELIVLPGAGRSMLVVDRTHPAGDDPRLVAHLAADEPASNAILVCHHYLSNPSGRWCRPLTPDDHLADPATDGPSVGARPTLPAEIADGAGRRYAIHTVSGRPRSAAELRWVRPGATGGEVVSLRAVVAALEDYQPACAMTAAAVANAPAGTSVSALRAELRRVQSSRVVLNRALREAVVRAVGDGLSLSTIAERCGRVRRDRSGAVTGETSWLSRRLGLLPEARGGEPARWVHSDVLALIARRGLGVCPREVELG